MNFLPFEEIPQESRNCVLLAVLAQIKNVPNGFQAQHLRYCMVKYACDSNIARGIWVNISDKYILYN